MTLVDRTDGVTRAVGRVFRAALAGVLVLVSAGAAHAGPGREGVPLGLAAGKRGELGLLYGGSAVMAPRNTFGILATLDYWQMSDLFAAGLNQQRLENAGAFTITLADFLELFINGTSTSHLIKDAILDDRILAQSIGDFLIGTKWGLRANHWLWIAADVSSQFRTDAGGIGPKLGATGVATRLMLTADMTASNKVKPVRFNLNLGFAKDNAYKLLSGNDRIDPISRYALGIPYDDQAFIGVLSAEFPQEFVNFFLEYSTEQYVDMNDSQAAFLPKRTFGTNPQRFTPGLRIFPVAGMHIDVAVDLGHNLFLDSARYDITGFGLLEKIEPDWIAHLGVGYMFYPPKPEMPKEGKVIGVVYDGRDRKPIDGVRITFPGQNTTTLLTSGDGRYRSYAFPSGSLKVRVDKDSYQSVETTVTVLAGQEIVRDFVLEFVEQAGELIGQLSDAQGNAVAGTVEFKEEGFGPLSADPSTGQFQMKLKPGVYTLKAVATGFESALKRIRIANSLRTVVNFVLQPAVVAGTLQGSVRDREGGPIAAVIRFNDSALPPVNVDAATGSYTTTLPPGSYSAKAFAQGYDADEKSFRIAKDSITVLDFVLSEAKQTGKVSGTVVDARTKAGVYAVLSFPNGERPNVPADPESGRFVLELDAGSYQVKAANPNYRSSTVAVKVDKGGESTLTIELQPYDKVRVTDDQVRITEQLQFTSGKATIKIESYPVLDEIAQVLKEVPEMKLTIEGHTDSVGDAATNKRLSQKRAEAVRDYLISRGVRADRLTAAGFGEERSIAENTTEAGRETNRRVEFHINK